MTMSYSPTTGRPLNGEGEAVATLSDDELEIELTVASHDPVRRATRYDRLVRERLARQRSRRRTARHDRTT